MAQSYDTLDSVDTNGANDIADVYQLVVGEAMEAPDLCGWMSTGPLNQSYSHGGYWGRYPLSFEGHPEVWFVRCAPVGSIGKPLKHGELRQISVLVRESETSKNSVVTNIKLWRRPRRRCCFPKHLRLAAAGSRVGHPRTHRRRVARASTCLSAAGTARRT